MIMLFGEGRCSEDGKGEKMMFLKGEGKSLSMRKRGPSPHPYIHPTPFPSLLSASQAVRHRGTTQLDRLRSQQK